MQTPWFPIGNDKHAALEKAGTIWNRRLNRPAATEGDLLDLVRKEVSPVDAPYSLDLLSRTDEDWEARGPIFAALAQKIIDGKITARDFWPVEPVLKDAARSSSSPALSTSMALRQCNSRVFRQRAATRSARSKPVFLWP
ncbi:hypothetical protein [Paraburkholderia dipogonis]